MKKILSLLLVVVLALSMAACGTNSPTTAPTEEPTTAPTTEPTTAPTAEPTVEPTVAPTEEPTEEPTVEKTMSMLMLSTGDDTTMNSITIYDDEMGGVYVDFNVNGVRKVTTLSLDVLAGLEAALNDSGMMDLAGTEEYGEGTNSASVYVSYTDWSSVSVSYYGVELPENFTTAYNALVAYVETLLVDVPQYVPQAQVMGEVDETILTEMQAIVNNANIANLDMMAIMDIPTDDAESFTFTAGLSSAEGISAAAICQNMMMGGGVYTIVIVKAADTAAVAADFEASVNWTKDICVQPANAMIATKGDLVLCLLASDAQYTDTVAAMASNGWTTVTELDNPNM